MLFEPKTLKGKVAVVTGGSRGLGRAIAVALAEAGACVALVGRDKEKCRETAAVIADKGGESLVITADVTHISDITQIFNKTLQWKGKADILINNAGVAITKKAFKISEEDWDLVIDTNLKSVFFCSQKAAQIMEKSGGGKIINMSSVMAMVGELSVSPYCASKGGVSQLTKALALEWVEYNIQVNAIAPGCILTDMNHKTFFYEKAYHHILGKIPMKKPGCAEDIGHIAVYLSSSASDYITGQTFCIDGGWTAQ